MKEIMVKAKSLEKCFAEIQALRGIDFQLRSQRITSLLGANGAGKTTLIRILLGFLKADAGEFSINTRRVAYVPEMPVYFNWASGYDVLNYNAAISRQEKSELIAQVECWAASLDFDPGLLPRRIVTYSAGNRKKYALLQNLLLAPELLVVDEPFNHLDPNGIRLVRRLFLDLKERGVTVLLSSHLISEAERLTDDLVILKQGAIVLQADYGSFKKEYRLFTWPKTKKPDIANLPGEVKEVEDHCQFLLKPNGKELLPDSWNSRDKLIREMELDLESIYFFFNT